MGETITFEPVAVADLAAATAHVSTAGYMLLKTGDGKGAALLFEIHDDGTVIPPDGWEAVIENGAFTGAAHTGQPAADAHLRRWAGWAQAD